MLTVSLALVFLLLGVDAAEGGWRELPMPAGSGWCRPILLDDAGQLYVGRGPRLSGVFDRSYIGGYVYEGGAWQSVSALSNAHWSGAVQDSTGHVWIATYDGVYRKDGDVWTRYSTADGLYTNWVQGLIVDHRGNIWAGSTAGAVPGRASYFDGEGWHIAAINTAGSDSINYLEPLMVDSSGAVWFGSINCFFRFDGATWTRYTLPDGVGTGVIQYITQDRRGTIRILSVSGAIWRFDGETLRPDGGRGQELVSDSRGTLWRAASDSCYDASQVFCSSHLDRCDDGHWRRWSPADSFFSYMQAMYLSYADRVGALWFSGNTRISRFDPEGVSIFKEPKNDFSYRHATPPDSAGNLWFPGASGGFVKFDGSRWSEYRASDGLASDTGISEFQDHNGVYWFGTDRGLSRWDGSSWTTFVQPDSLGRDFELGPVEDTRGTLWKVGGATGSEVSYFDGTSWNDIAPLTARFPTYIAAPIADQHGRVWFAGGPYDTLAVGITWFDGTTWSHYGTGSVQDPNGADGLEAEFEDRAGNLWFATIDWVIRFDGNDWTFYGGMPRQSAAKMFMEDRNGTLWLATLGLGAYRFDGVEWQHELHASGGFDEGLWDLVEDAVGGIWGFGVGGVFHFDGTAWAPYGRSQGLPDYSEPWAYFTDQSGALWFSGLEGTVRYDPDYVPPITQLISHPPRVSSGGTLSATAVVVYESGSEFEYSTRLDEGLWSPWSPVGTWSESRLPDGVHVIQVRARDYAHNVGPAAVDTFEVDATPPAPLLASPQFGDPVRGVVDVRGTATDARFRSYRLEYRPTGAANWDGATLLVQSTTQVSNGVLGSWDTTTLPDGPYDLRASVADSLGLVGSVVISVIVDNHAPYFDETAPAKVSAAAGGDVFTTNAETHLYFPPHAFAQDAVVMVAPEEAGSVPSPLPSGAVKVLDGYEIEWASTLRKPARFTLSYAGATLPAGTLALYRSADGASWERLGGTPDAREKSISLAVSLPGRYALFADNGAGAGTASLSPLAFTPRVFSPSGTFADRQVGISFRLGKPAPVTVRVFSRSGRLIRDVVTGLPLNAGDNLIRWDGTDRNGGIVVDGMYLVTVEALGHTETKTLAVVK